MSKHQGFGDKNCPDCGNKSVHWISNGVRTAGDELVEFGRFKCNRCGWKSGIELITIEAGETKE